MHFFYIDEAGCDLRDLKNPESPIFILGGIIVTDEGWNKTYKEFENIISTYFNHEVPKKFELHSHELLSPKGDGFFKNHPRSARSELAADLLELIRDRKHQIMMLAIEKSKLSAQNTTGIRNKDHVELKVPYLLCYDNAISMIESYVKDKLGSSARGLVIIDEKEGIKKEIEEITKFRRFDVVKSKRIKWISEFSYAVDSKKNPMIQLSDLCCFITKKFLGIESGYHDSYPVEAKVFYRDMYSIIDSRLIRKRIVQEEGRHADAFNAFMNAIAPKIKNGWKTRLYKSN